MKTPNPRPYAHIKGVSYPAEPKKPRLPLPQGCPRVVRSLAMLAPWIHAAGLWDRPPCRRTLTDWNRAGLIVTKKGATGKRLIDVPATLRMLTPDN